LKKILIFLLCCIVFSFAEDLSDTVPHIVYEDTPDTIVVAEEEAEEEAEAIEEETIEEETIEEAIEEEAETIDPNSPATLTISTTPPNASILINRRRVGNSPFTVRELNPNEQYGIMILRDGFELFDTTVTLSGGANDTLSIILRPENSAVIVSSEAENIESAEVADDTVQTADEDIGAKKKKTDRIGIIIFLSIMFLMIGMQEYNNR